MLVAAPKKSTDPVSAAYRWHALAGLAVALLGAYGVLDAVLKSGASFGTRQASGMLVYMPLLLLTLALALAALWASILNVARWRAEPLLPGLCLLLLVFLGAGAYDARQLAAVVLVSGGLYAVLALVTGWRRWRAARARR